VARTLTATACGTKLPPTGGCHRQRLVLATGSGSWVDALLMCQVPKRDVTGARQPSLSGFNNRVAARANTQAIAGGKESADAADGATSNGRRWLNERNLWCQRQSPVDGGVGTVGEMCRIL
jgi:hypothetical protein